MTQYTPEQVAAFARKSLAFAIDATAAAISCGVEARNREISETLNKACALGLVSEALHEQMREQRPIAKVVLSTLLDAGAPTIVEAAPRFANAAHLDRRSNNVKCLEAAARDRIARGEMPGRNGTTGWKTFLRQCREDCALAPNSFGTSERYFKTIVARARLLPKP